MSPKYGEQPIATQAASTKTHRSHRLQKGKEPAVIYMPAGGVGGGSKPGVRAEPVGSVEPIDRLDLGGDYSCEDRTNS
jgi:hypothetical protein